MKDSMKHEHHKVWLSMAVAYALPLLGMGAVALRQWWRRRR